MTWIDFAMQYKQSIEFLVFAIGIGILLICSRKK
jgi:hypothetical protein